jgi:hypothetical protein
MRGGKSEIGSEMARLMAVEFQTEARSLGFWSEFLGRLWSYLAVTWDFTRECIAGVIMR